MVNMKAVLLARDMGRMVDMAESAYSVPTVRRGTAPLARIRTAVTESVFFLT